MFNQSKTAPPQAAGPDDADAALVGRCRQGDMEAFGALVRRHDQPITALVARLLGPGVTAGETDETVQEVFAQAWHTLPSFRHATKFSTWLTRIAVHHAHTQRRSILRQAQTALEEEMPTTVRDALAGLMPGPADAASLRARDRDLRTAIDRLPEKQRTAVLLHYFEDVSCEETAQILGCSVEAAWAHLHDACGKLHESVSWLGE